VGHTFTGVFFSLGGPLDANEGAFGDVVLRVTVDLGLRDLRFWEWQEEVSPSVNSWCLRV
jgi:hypothetical protein